MNDEPKIKKVVIHSNLKNYPLELIKSSSYVLVLEPKSSVLIYPDQPLILSNTTFNKVQYRLEHKDNMYKLDLLGNNEIEN